MVKIVGKILIALALVACSGAGPAGMGPGGGGALDGGGAGGNALGGGGAGPQGGAPAAAQPLSGSYVFPEGDPNGHVMTINFVDQDPVCRESTPGIYGYVLSGFLVPPVSYQDVSGHVLRWIDTKQKKYVDILLQNRGDLKPPNTPIFLNYTGHFELEVSSSYPPALEAYPLADNAAKDKLGQWLSCPDQGCVPSDAYPKIVLEYTARFDANDLANLITCDAYRLQLESNQLI